MNLTNWKLQKKIENSINKREENTYYIYLHTCPNGKVYVGQTKNPKARWRPYLYKGNKEFYRDINIYGWKNIKHEILATTNYGWIARKLEKDLINKYKKIAYNISNTVYNDFLSEYTRLHKKS